MPKAFSIFSFALLMSILFGVSSNADAQAYSVTDLKSIPPYYWTTPLGLSESGTVVGYSTKTHLFDANGPAWKWTAAAGIQSLGIGVATAINTKGDIAGITGAQFHAFLWKQDGTTLDLGTLGGDSSAAYAINSDDWIVGWSTIVGDQEPAFQWTPEQGMQSLGTGNGDATAQAINDLGEVAGWSTGPAGNDAFSWTQSAGMQDIGQGFAWGINNSRIIVGQIPAGLYVHAALWQQGTPQDLGTLGGNNSVAQAINDFGTVVGTSDATPSGQPSHAFVWTAKRGMHDLNSLIPVSVQKQWRLTSGNAVNNAGQIAVLAVPPSGAVSHALLLSPLMYVTLTASPNPSIVGEIVTFTAATTSIVGAPPDGEEVTFKSGSTILGTALLAGGVATFQTSSLTVGTHSITATYAGDVNYASAKSPAVSQVVNK